MMHTTRDAARHGRRGRWRFIAALLAALFPSAVAIAAFQPERGAGPASRQAAEAEDPERGEEAPAAVRVGGDPVIWITSGVGPYSPQLRADRISQRLAEAIRDRTLTGETIVVTESSGSSELRLGPRLLMVVTARDAESLGVPRRTLAQHQAGELDAAIRAERLRYAPAALVRSGVYSALATILFAFIVWMTARGTRKLRNAAARWLVPRSESLRAMQAELLADSRVGRAITGATRVVRIALVLVATDLYLTYLLGLFPWTRPVSTRLLEYVITPIRAVWEAFVGYLPNLLFLVVIGAVFYAAIKLVGLFFRQVEQGRIVAANFPAEWADPTNKIARILLIAFGLVVAFPYLPASSSPAFAGVSVFMGVLFSLASSSALSNMIAGIVLTYTGAFRLGDRVKVGDVFGDIVETSLLATRVRTIKNESITIPNGIVLGSSVTNYSRPGKTPGLILHTSVTIGYDAPWRRVHDLLVAAALDTPGVLKEPAPFVWQTALNDFYVTYEINAYTGTPREMIDIYAALHARIQDTFFEAGVEIMSPHFTSIRDGNTVAIPEAMRKPGYTAPAFRVDGGASATVSSFTPR